MRRGMGHATPPALTDQLQLLEFADIINKGEHLPQGISRKRVDRPAAAILSDLLHDNRSNARQDGDRDRPTGNGEKSDRREQESNPRRQGGEPWALPLSYPGHVKEKPSVVKACHCVCHLSSDQPR